ncbi:MAG: hypothetical protein LBH11_04905 [Propionibacteriaceae bacterium]|jgi:hypothetical protein|nr:hypothetical protein [Propionibacteriaceae bacterium]
MRFRDICIEAWRNITTGTTHALRWMLVLLLSTGALVWLDATTIRAQLQDVATYINGGGATWVVNAPGRIDGAACDALAETDGIIASGALRQSVERPVLAQLPSALTSFFDATTGLLGLLHAPTRGGVAATDKLAAQLGITVPGVLHTTAGAFALDAIFSFPSDGRDASLGYAVISPADTTQPFDDCWAQIWPSDDTKQRLLYLAVLPAGSNDLPTQFAQLNPTLAASYHPSELFQHRATNWTTLACLLVGVIAGIAATVTRRLELASALHSGLSKNALLKQLLLETLFWAGVALSTATPILLLSAATAIADHTQVALLTMRGPILGTCGALLGTMSAVLLLRERQLFIFFKDR